MEATDMNRATADLELDFHLTADHHVRMVQTRRQTLYDHQLDAYVTEMWARDQLLKIQQVERAGLEVYGLVPPDGAEAMDLAVSEAKVIVQRILEKAIAARTCESPSIAQS
jgi:hypothetical protein